MAELKARLDGYLAGVGQRQGASGVKAGWVGAIVGMLALAVALVLALIDVI